MSVALFRDGLSVQEQVPAKSLTTFGVGGLIRYLIDPRDTGSLAQALKAAHDASIDVRILGNGSNVVFSDEGFPGAVVRLGRAFEWITNPPDKQTGEQVVEPAEDELFVGAGASLMSLSRKLSQEGRTGLEFAAGIPASLGGAVKMNAGAHGSSMSAVVRGAQIMTKEGTVFFRTAEALQFRYRHSSIEENEIVLGAVLKLPFADSSEILKRRQECLDYRKRTQPLHLPSAGSVFRNPEVKAAAYYLEQTGLKGHRIGGVMYSELHSNWLVRVDDSASAEEVRALITLGQVRVFESSGIKLTPEILLW